MEKAKKQNKFLYILKLPFLGVFYFVDFIFKLLDWEIIGIFTFFKPLFIFLEYVCLGCYYTLYALLFPFIFIIGKIGDLLFKSYKKSKPEKIDLQKIAPNEPINMDSSEEENITKKEEPAPNKNQTKDYFKKKYDDFYFVRKQKEKDEEQYQNLIKEVQRDNTRSEKPVTFRYTAINPDGKKETNVFLAYSKIEVFSYLTNEGYKVLKIETSKSINFLYGPSSFGGYKLKNKDLIFWLTQLSTYIKSGIPLTESMKILGKQMSKNARKKRLFDSIIYYLILGESFSTALQKQNNAFPPLLVSMIKTAEATGELEETLDDMANYYTDIENTRKAMISAMSYPAIITVFSIAVVVFILLYVIPQFESVYSSSGATLNSFTLAIISISAYLQSNLMQLLGIIAGIIVVIVVLYKKVKGFRLALQTFAMKLPLFGNIIIYKEMNVFAKTFASLLKNNVFITDSMNLLTNITNNEVYKQIMFKTINNIAKGDKISTAFKDQWAVPEVAYYMIVTGESTGELASMMGKVADYYQTEHKTIINSMKAFIEPAMIIFLAVIVGGIIMAVILPMFGLYEQIS